MCLLLVALLGAPTLADAADRDLQPVPPRIVFENPEDFEPETLVEISAQIEESFADLNKVTLARERLIRRFGLVSVIRLRQSLRGGSGRGISQPHAWNAALTLAGMRDALGPAPAIQRAIPDLFKMLTGGGEEYGKAFAALAIGCFPWTDGEGAGADPRLKTVPGPTTLRNNIHKRQRDAREFLATFAASPSNSGVLSRASLLALAKMGGAEASKLICAIDPKVSRNNLYQKALLLARAFALASDAKPCFEALHKEQRDVAVAAALSVAVALLVEDRPDWTKDREAVDDQLEFLVKKGTKQKEEVAASLFGRGMNALVNDAPKRDWQRIWEETTHASVKDHVAEVGAQVMLFCPQRWFQDEIVTWATRPTTPPSHAVRSMVLLRAGELATPLAVEACIRWIRTGSERPKPRADWDPRWYAIVGLLRSLHRQRLTDPMLREQVIDALERAERAILKPSPFKDALERLLKQHGKVLRGSSTLPRAALEDVERSMPDAWGLLAADARDVCAHRVNLLVEEIFNFGAIVPSKTGDPQKTLQGERYLRRYLDVYPYFSRLQFQKRRGVRDRVLIDDARPEGLNR